MDLVCWIGGANLDCVDDIGYGIHYPIRHGQVENWVRTICAEGRSNADGGRIIWNGSGPILFSSICE